MSVSWSQGLLASPETFSRTLSQFLWFNKHIKAEGTAISFANFSIRDINFLPQLFENGKIILWVNFKDEYELTNDMFFQWAHLKHAIPARWKKLINEYSDVNGNDVYQNHLVIKRARDLFPDKLSSKEIHSNLISNTVNKPTSNIFLETIFENITLDWSKIYLPSRLAAIDTVLELTMCSFQCKILNNVLLLNKNLDNFRTNNALRSFCNTLGETHIYIFFNCIHVKCLWERLQTKFQKDFILPSLTPQTAILGLIMKHATTIIFLVIFY